MKPDESGEKRKTDSQAGRSTAKESYKTAVRLRTAVDILFLFVFAALIAAGKIQLWFALFALGVLVSTVAGRFYCGWICPMHTLQRPVQFLHRKLEKLRKRRTVPRILDGPAARYIALVLFIASVVSQQAFGFKAPMLPILTAIAVLLALFFEERWWHSVLCPFGTVLGGSSSRAKFGLSIDEERCTGCGICEQVCPAGAVVKLSDERTAVRSIDTSRCLLCYTCAKACPFDTIRYGRLRS